MQLGTYTIDGGPLLYDEQFGTFEVGGKTVTADRVRELDHLEKIVWSGETSRAWFHSAFPGTVPAAPTAVASPGKPKSTAIGCGILLVLVVAASLGLSTCSSKSAAPKADVAVLRASTLNAINAMPDIAGGVYGVEAYENGNVAVRLKFTKAVSYTHLTLPTIYSV